MAYIPGVPQVIRDKALVQWVSDGEDGDEEVLNRHVNNVADMTVTLRSDAVVTDPAFKGLTEQTVTGPINFTGRVTMNNSSASDDAVAMAIALG